MQPYFKKAPQSARQSNQHRYQHQPYNSQMDLNQEKKQIEDILREKQMEFLRRREKEYESQLREKQSLGQKYLNKYEEQLKEGDETVQNYHRHLQLKLLEDNRIRQDIIFQGHLKRYLELKQESKILNHRQYLHSSLQPGENSRKIKYKMTIDDNNAENQRFVKEYQEELQKKMAKGKKNSRKNNNKKRLSAQSNISSLGKTIGKYVGKENLIINKNTIQIDSLINKKGLTKTKKDTVKACLNSKHINNVIHRKNQIDSTFAKSKQTFDLSSIQASFANTKNEKKIDTKATKTTKFSSQSERETLKKKSKIDKKIKIEQQSIHPLARIQNRLRLSMIVFTDSKMKNKSYELGHLLNTYQAEIRLRKSVIDRINDYLIRQHRRTISHSIR